LADEIEPLKGRRIYLLLRDRILSGELPAGGRLTGEPGLAAEHGVARVTVRRALASLAADGLIERRPGSGTFVREGKAMRPVVGDLVNTLSHLAEMGRRTDVRLLAFGYGPPPAAIAAALRLKAGALTQRAVRVRLADGEPFSHLTTHVPEAIGRHYGADDLAAGPLLALLERSGRVIERASQSIGAALAGPDVAEALGCEVGAPVIALTRTAFDASGAGVEHLRALYRPDRYAFESELVREGPGGDRRWAPALLRPANCDSAQPVRRRSRPEP
jgi:GntR family transcriptional regulator